jgi:Flp pilus assembly protein TadG
MAGHEGRHTRESAQCPRPHDGDGARSGQALLWVVVMLPIFLAIIGLALDGGALFAARRQVQNAADGAARAGAQQIDLDKYRATGEIALDDGWARYVARQYVAGLGGLEAAVDIAGNQVIVTVRRDVPLSFLKLVGVGEVRVGAMAVAEPFYGIAEGRR